MGSAVLEACICGDKIERFAELNEMLAVLVSSASAVVADAVCVSPVLSDLGVKVAGDEESGVLAGVGQLCL